MGQIKVCHLTTAHDPFDDRIFHKECKSLSKAGYDVRIIAQHSRNESVEGIGIIALSTSRNRLHRMFGLSLQAFYKACIQNADIYHIHDPELLPFALILKLLFRKVVIYDVHEDYAKQTLSKAYLPKITRRGISLVIKAMEQLSLKVLDGIITATDDILNNFPDRQKAASVKNFPILEYFSEPRGTAARDVRDSGFFNLVYVGIISEARGAVEIIDSLRYVKQSIKLTLYGKFYPRDYEMKVKELEGFQHVDYHGWVDHEDIPALLKRYDCGIVCLYPIPNYLTALPIKLFEYMAAGIPVIASDFPLWKEIVEGNSCGICVNPLDPRRIADAIMFLIDNPGISAKMGANGRNAVLAKFNWENESSKMLHLYRKISAA